MDRVRWSQKAVSFRSLMDNQSIPKPVLVQIGNKEIVVGEKINGEFIMASPCKVFGDRFDVMEQEIVLSSKHTGVWRVISRATSKKEGPIHRLTTKDLERIYREDVKKDRQTPRSYICIRDVEAFDLIVHSNDPTIAGGRRIERRMKQIDEDVEFEITETGEVEYTPSEGERTSQDYVMIPKKKQATFLQLLLPGVVEEEQVVRNRVLRALYCVTKGDTRKRQFLLEVNEQPCEIRPIASEGSTELRYLHSTQNLYDYMLTYGNDTVLYVKLLRGDPPIKAVEFDGYMVLKSTLNGDKVPICRVEDLEITLVSPDIPVQVKIPTKGEHTWRSLSEVRAAEVQCMQISLALLARHESEMYVTLEAKANTNSYLTTSYNKEQRDFAKRQTSDALKKHIEECEAVFSSASKVPSRTATTTHRSEIRSTPSVPTESIKQLSIDDSSGYGQQQQQQRRQHHRHSQPSNSNSIPTKISSPSHTVSDKLYRTRDKRAPQERRESSDNQLQYSQVEQADMYNRFNRPTIRGGDREPSSSSTDVASSSKTNYRSKPSVL